MFYKSDHPNYFINLSQLKKLMVYENNQLAFTCAISFIKNQAIQAVLIILRLI